MGYCKCTNRQPKLSSVSDSPDALRVFTNLTHPSSRIRHFPKILHEFGTFQAHRPMVTTICGPPVQYQRFSKFLPAFTINSNTDRRAARRMIVCIVSRARAGGMRAELHAVAHAARRQPRCRRRAAGAEATARDAARWPWQRVPAQDCGVECEFGLRQQNIA